MSKRCLLVFTSGATEIGCVLNLRGPRPSTLNFHFRASLIWFCSWSTLSECTTWHVQNGPEVDESHLMARCFLPPDSKRILSHSPLRYKNGTDAFVMRRWINSPVIRIWYFYFLNNISVTTINIFFLQYFLHQNEKYPRKCCLLPHQQQ